MICDCHDCPFCGIELCVHRKLMDENNGLKATIKEAKDRLTYYFSGLDGFRSNPEIQNVYDVLSRLDNNSKDSEDEERWRRSME